MQFSTIPYITIQYITIQYNTIQYIQWPELGAPIGIRPSVGVGVGVGVGVCVVVRLFGDGGIPVAVTISLEVAITSSYRRASNRQAPALCNAGFALAAILGP